MCARLQLQLQLSNPCRQSRRQRLSRRPPRPPYTNHAHAHEISRINYSNLISFKYTHPLGCSTACLLACLLGMSVCLSLPPPPQSCPPHEKLENLCSKVFATSSGCFEGGGRRECRLACGTITQDKNCCRLKLSVGH